MIGDYMLALNPKYRLSKARSNIFFYSFDKENLNLTDQKCIHPNTAVILSFFNGNNSMDEIKSAVMHLFDLSENSYNQQIEEFFQEWNDYFIDVNQQVRFEDPINYIIPADEVDLTKINLEKPIYIGYNITQKCSGRKCIYCYAETADVRKINEMSIEHIDGLLKEMASLKVEFVNLGGGDPLASRNVYHILEILSEAGIFVHLSTKQFVNQSVAEKLTKAGLRKMQFSIDCLDNSLSKRLTGVSDFASRAINSIKLLIKNGISVSINSVVTALNINDIPNLVDRLVSLGIKKIGLSQYNRSGYHHNDILFVTKAQIKKLYDYILDFQISNNDVDISLSSSYTLDENQNAKGLDGFLNRPICSAGKTSLMIMPDGSVIPCEQIPCDEPYILGNVGRQGILGVWNSKIFRDFFVPEQEKFNGSICRDCDAFKLCILEKGWCFRDAWKAYGTIYEANPACPKAKDRKGKRLF